MNAKFVQQMLVFAAIFLLCQVGLDWVQGRAVSAQSFLSMVLVTGVVTALYGAFILFVNNRRGHD